MRQPLNLVKKVISLKQSLFYREQNHCCLCGSELRIEVVVSSQQQNIVEKVRCEKCSVSVREKNFVLQ